jgi:hypothetical protein
MSASFGVGFEGTGWLSVDQINLTSAVKAAAYEGFDAFWVG